MTGVDAVRPEDVPFHPEDLALCQRVFDGLRRELEIEHDRTGSELLASYVLSYYRRGAKNEAQLSLLAKSKMVEHRIPSKS